MHRKNYRRCEFSICRTRCKYYDSLILICKLQGWYFSVEVQKKRKKKKEGEKKKTRKYRLPSTIIIKGNLRQTVKKVLNEIIVIRFFVILEK